MTLFHRILRRLAWCTICATTVVSFVINPFAYAVTQNDLDSIYYGTPFYDPLADGCVPDTITSNQGSPLENYTLPTTAGRTGQEAAINADGIVDDKINPGNPDNGHSVALAAALQTIPAGKRQPYQDYYINMRWNYVSWNWNGTSSNFDQTQYKWMVQQPRLVLVTNPRTGQSIIADALETGPAPWTGVDTAPNNIPKQGWVNPQKGTPSGYTGRVSGLAPKAITALGAKMGMTDGSGDVLTYSWAPNQDAVPGPVSSSDTATIAGAPSCVSSKPGSTTDGVVFISQRDKKWDGQQVCWTLPVPGCGSVHDEGCWASSQAMIISTFRNHPWPNVITPMQVEGPNVTNHVNFASVGLKQSQAYDTTTPNLRMGMNEVKSGNALLYIHGTYGGPFYNTGNHWEVVRAVAPDNQHIYVNDPWDMPLNGDSSKPDPVQHFGSATYKAHSVTEYTMWDVTTSSDQFYIISK